MNNSNKIKTAIIGASGYTGEALLGLSLQHPLIDVTSITSREFAGKSIGDVMPRYSANEISFITPDINQIKNTAEAVFICLPHGLSAEFAVPLYRSGLKIFDLGADFRLKSTRKYSEHYVLDHPAPNVLSEAVYGLPEKNRTEIQSATLVACPGCYPTSVIIPLLPLLRSKLISTRNIIVCSMSGVSGAGKKADTSLLFAECSESVRSYSAIGHRHTPEMEQELREFAGLESLTVEFTPNLIPVKRGINTIAYLDLINEDISLDQIETALSEFYVDEPFVRILPKGKLADTKNVTHTNSIEIGFNLNPRTQRIILTSAIDNLIKGAAGQAIQCFNLVYGFEETMGLIR